MAQDSKRIVGCLPGVWDLIHPGHIRAMKQAKEQCDYLIVAVNKNPDKKTPTMTWQERVEMVEAIKYVDEVITVESNVDLFKMDEEGWGDVRIMGSDHKNCKHHPIKAKVIYITRDHDYSTTAIRARITG